MMKKFKVWKCPTHDYFSSERAMLPNRCYDEAVEVETEVPKCMKCLNQMSPWFYSDFLCPVCDKKKIEDAISGT